MVTFSCEVCNETVPKKNTEKHYWRCPDAVYTCIDCSKTFHDGVGYKNHTQCISEDEKYQKGLYKGKNKGKRANANANGNGNANGISNGNGNGNANGISNGNGNGGNQVKARQTDNNAAPAKKLTEEKGKDKKEKQKQKETKVKTKKVTKNKSCYDHKSLLKEGVSLYEILKSLKSQKDEKKHLLKSLVVNSSGKIVLKDENSA